MRLLPALLALLPVWIHPSEASSTPASATGQAQPGPPDEPPVTVSGAPGQGVTVAIGDAYSLNVKSRAQVRYQANWWEDAARSTEQLVAINTLRFWLSGNLYGPELTYLVQLALASRDYREGAISPVYDAYVEWRPDRDLNLRVGQYFVPFDRLRTVREWALQIPERPKPVQEFTLDRDTGATLFSDNFLADRSPVAWRIGVFGGRGTNQALAARPSALVTARVELRPLGAIDDDREGDLQRLPAPRLALGLGFARNFNSSRLRSTTGATFAGGTTDDKFVETDVVFKWRGWALEAEYLWKRAVADRLATVDAAGAPSWEYTRSGAGWVVQTSYVFNPPVEIVGRLSRLYAQSTLDPVFISTVRDRGSELGAGLNYYFNAHRFKVQAAGIMYSDASLNPSRADHVALAALDVTF